MIWEQPRLVLQSLITIHIQIKDLRTYFNWVLVSQLGLSNKEAGSYLGNSEAVNNQLYTPVNLEAMSAKLRSKGPEMILSQIAA